MANDYIIREAAWNGIYNCPTKRDADGYIWVRTSDVGHMIDDIPAADVRPVVRGEWLAYPILDDMCFQHYSCSVCKRIEAIPHGYDVKKELPFCHCGADMREVKVDGN